MLIFIKRKGPTYYNQYRGCKGVCGRGECSPYRYGAGEGGGEGEEEQVGGGKGSLWCGRGNGTTSGGEYIKNEQGVDLQIAL